MIFQATNKQCRAEEYPPLGEFVDAYYWKQRGDPEPMLDYLAQVEQVKKKYPKDTESN